MYMWSQYTDTSNANLNINIQYIHNGQKNQFGEQYHRASSNTQTQQELQLFHQQW